MPRAVIDPFPVLPGEDRCIHDQLVFIGRTTTCAICLGLPDVPDGDAVDFHDPAVRWLVTERWADCNGCGDELRPGSKVTWRASTGLLCRDCTERGA